MTLSASNFHSGLLSIAATFGLQERGTNEIMSPYLNASNILILPGMALFLHTLIITINVGFLPPFPFALLEKDLFVPLSLSLCM